MPGLLFQKPTIILDTPWQVNKSAGFALGMLAFSQKIRHAPVLYGMLYFKLLRYKTKLPPKALAFQKFYSLYTFVCTQQNTSSSALCFMMYPPLKKPRAGVNSRQLTVMMKSNWLNLSTVRTPGHHVRWVDHYKLQPISSDLRTRALPLTNSQHLWMAALIFQPCAGLSCPVETLARHPLPCHIFPPIQQLSVYLQEGWKGWKEQERDKEVYYSLSTHVMMQ